MSTLKATNLQHKDSSNPNVVLYADGSTSIRNLQNLAPSLIQNGAMTVHQRGTSQTNVGSAFGYFVQDRWCIAANGGPARFTMSSEADAPAGFSKSLKMTTTTAGAIGTNQYVKVYQPIEALNCQLLNFGSANARTISLSFWVKSSVTGTYNLNAYHQDANRRYSTTYTIDVANTWEYKSLVIPGDTGGSINDDNGYGLSVDFVLAAGSGFTSNDQNDKWIDDTGNARHFGQGVDLGATNGQTWQVTGVQLTATDAPIEFQHEDYGTTLAKCQRYFERTNLTGHVMVKTGLNNEFRGTYFYKTAKRAGAIVTRVSNDGGSLKCQPGGVAVSNLTFQWPGTNQVAILVDGNTNWNSQSFEDTVLINIGADL